MNVLLAHIKCWFWMIGNNLFLFRFHHKFTYKVVTRDGKRLRYARVIAAITSDDHLVKVFYSSFGRGFAESAVAKMKLEREKRKNDCLCACGNTFRPTSEHWDICYECWSRDIDSIFGKG